MIFNGSIMLVLYLITLLIITIPLGMYIAQVMDGRIRFYRMESVIYRICSIRDTEEMNWWDYTWSILLFNLWGVIVVYLLQRWQFYLPLNPQQLPDVSIDSALNTAISFVTNTNWQGYAGESTMSYLTQMLGLAVQNFLSAATGIVVVIALIRGFARHSAATIGNAWVDLTRITLYVLLPISLIYALFLISQGVIQNFNAYQSVVTLEGNTQILPMGPVASQEAIKMLGTNGGGFFNANSAHPYENPNPLTNFSQMLIIFLIPGALCITFGKMVHDIHQGWAILLAMIALFVVSTLAIIIFEQQGNPLFSQLGVDLNLGNMEGKEVRFGSAVSSFFASVTTLASCGAVNAMHDSFTPLGGFIALWNMMLGEVVFGGVGSGLYGMLIFAIITVFIAGLMVGRTPEYLGKKIEAFEMKMVALAILITPLLVLFGTAIAVSIDPGVAGIANPGAHGFSEILYALTSAANNNGSAFAGLSVNTPFYNFLLAIVMLLGRFGVIIPTLALAGALVKKKRSAAHSGTLPTHGLLFILLLIGTVVLVGALNYIPALALGPIIEHLILGSHH